MAASTRLVATLAPPHTGHDERAADSMAGVVDRHGDSAAGFGRDGIDPAWHEPMIVPPREAGYPSNRPWAKRSRRRSRFSSRVRWLHPFQPPALQATQ